MKEVVPINSIVTLIRSLPTLPKERICELWRESLGKPPGRLRTELMLPILAFRI
jgi:hypothetical protein